MGMHVYYPNIEADGWRFRLQDVTMLGVFSVAVALTYVAIKPIMRTPKAKAWIIMLISSLILSIFGCIYVYCTTVNGNWKCDYLYGEDELARNINLFFVSSNIVDLLIGFHEYPSFMDPLSTITHHIVYILLEVLLLLPNHWSAGMAHCFFLEIPTLVLSIGSCWPEYRSDLLFGISFMITRLFGIIYLGYVVQLERPFDPMVFAILLVLGVHIFWFSKWVSGYATKLFGKSNNNNTGEDGEELDENGKGNK